MKKIILFLGLLLIVFCGNIFADTIYMNDGTVKVGKIKKENAFSYTIIIDGVEERVFRDQVKSVDKEIEKKEPSDLLKQLEKEGYVESYELENLEELTGEKKDLINALLEINGTVGLLRSNKEDIMRKVSADQFSSVDELLNLEGLVDEIIQLYAKHYSLEELRQIVSFYQSPAGQKVISITPIIMQEMMQVSVLYFQKHLINQ